MLNSLTYGLGAELGKKIRISYYDKENLILKHSLYQDFDGHQKESIKDLLALSIFYQYAIGPLHGSVEFMDNTKQYGVKSIGFGSYKFGEKMKKISMGITKGFYEILANHRIEISQLDVSSITEFIKINSQYITRVTK